MVTFAENYRLNMKELDEIRLSIDKIDRQLAVLFESRMKEVEKIAGLKFRNNLPITDLDRERKIKESNSEFVADDSVRRYLDAFYDSLLSISKQYQKDLYEKQYR